MKLYDGQIVCPTTLQNIIEYKRMWESFGSRPMGSIRKHFSEYVQQIVENSIDKNNSGNI
jgi:tRNA-dihydrouridine synthase